MAPTAGASKRDRKSAQQHCSSHAFSACLPQRCLSRPSCRDSGCLWAGHTSSRGSLTRQAEPPIHTQSAKAEAWQEIRRWQRKHIQGSTQFPPLRQHIRLDQPSRLNFHDGPH